MKHASVASPTLTVRNLRAAYGSHIVLEGVSFELQAGEWFVLLGPNGSGKSTLLDCIVGRLSPASGIVAITGRSLAEEPAAAKGRLGYACAPEVLPPLLTARQCLEVHAGAKGLDDAGTEVMDLAGALQFLPYLDSFVDTLSLGTRQKLSVLLGLVGDPALIVLDEAFNGLDPASARVLKRHLQWRLRERGATVLLATHALDIVEHYADRAALLLDGRLRREWSRADIESVCQGGSGFEATLDEP
jgi:ABC-2 type transport system ATP-binding protein